MNKLRRGFIPLIPLLIIGGSFLVTAAAVFVKTEGFRTFTTGAKASLPCSSFNTNPDGCNNQKYDDTKTQRCKWTTLSRGDVQGVTTERLLAQASNPEKTNTPRPRPSSTSTPRIQTPTRPPVVVTRPMMDPTDRPIATNTQRPSTVTPRPPTAIPKSVNVQKGLCIEVPKPTSKPASIPKPTPDSGDEMKPTCTKQCPVGYVCKRNQNQEMCAKATPTPTSKPTTPTPTPVYCVNMCYGKGHICLGKPDVEYCGIWYDPSMKNNR